MRSASGDSGIAVARRALRMAGITPIRHDPGCEIDPEERYLRVTVGPEKLNSDPGSQFT